jgi:hypothetical protein
MHIIDEDRLTFEPLSAGIRIIEVEKVRVELFWEPMPVRM